MNNIDTYTAFAGWTRVASGSLPEMLRGIYASQPQEPVLIFHDQSGKQVDFDMRGSVEEILARVAPKPGPGRPKLGVTSREISLLPRHWEWLETQPQGASAALRRLVDEARKQDSGWSNVRQSTDAAGRFMTAMAGNLAGFEEAYRALYAYDVERVRELTKDWPEDVRHYIAARF